MQFHLEAMNSDAMARAVSAAIRAIDPLAIIITNAYTRTLTVNTMLGETTIRAILTAAGFPPS
jgi:hypothetical protein